MKKMMTAMAAMLLATGLYAAEPAANMEHATMEHATPWHEKGTMLVLPDGTEVSKMEVVGVLATMKAIEHRSPKAAANILKRAHAPEMPLSPGLMKHLVKEGLINEDGTFPPEILDILKTFWAVDEHGNIAPVAPNLEQEIEEAVTPDDN